MSNRYTDPSRLTLSFYRWIYDPLRSRYFRDLVAWLDLRGDERILDVGSGPGSEAQHLVRGLAERGQVTCLDVSPAWLAEARRRLGGHPNVTFILGEATAVGLPAATYDVVLAHYILHDMDRTTLSTTLGALAVALRADGRFVAVEPASHHGLTAHELRGLMEGAGLQEVSSEATRSLGGAARRAVFRKG